MVKFLDYICFLSGACILDRGNGPVYFLGGFQVIFVGPNGTFFSYVFLRFFPGGFLEVVAFLISVFPAGFCGFVSIISVEK